MLFSLVLPSGVPKLPNPYQKQHGTTSPVRSTIICCQGYAQRFSATPSATSGGCAVCGDTVSVTDDLRLVGDRCVSFAAESTRRALQAVGGEGLVEHPLHAE